MLITSNEKYRFPVTFLCNLQTRLSEIICYFGGSDCFQYQYLCQAKQRRHDTNSCDTLQSCHISKHLKNNDAELVITTQSFSKPYTNFDSKYFKRYHSILNRYRKYHNAIQIGALPQMSSSMGRYKIYQNF